MKYFINLSGGFDSVYYLWKHLTEKPNEKILVHHCLLNESRKIVEKEATMKILDYFNKNKLSNFQYVESRFTRAGFRGKIMDIEPIYFMAGLILNYEPYKTVENILVPICYEEMNGSFKNQLLTKGTWEGYEDDCCRFYKSFLYCNTAARKKYTYMTPHFMKTKADIISELPNEVVDMVWYCRKPINNQPCGKCFNCKRVNKSRLK